MPEQLELAQLHDRGPFIQKRAAVLLFQMVEN